MISPLPDFTRLLAITDLYCKFDREWFVCGGWALDLFLNKVSRAHGDIEVGIARAEQQRLHAFLEGWNKSYVTSSKKIAWNSFHELTLPVHEIHAEKSGLEIEVLLNEFDLSDWIYRRKFTIKRDKNKAILYHGGLKLHYLAPEICLLYKSKHLRDKDQADFKNVFPLLNEESRSWLINAIRADNPQHVWLAA